MELRFRHRLYAVGLIFLASVLAGSAAGAADSDTSTGKAAGQEYVPNRVVVAFYSSPSVSVGPEGVAAAALSPVDDLNERFGVTRMEPLCPAAVAPQAQAVEQDVSLSSVYVLTFTADIDPTEAAAAYADLKEVRYAEPDYIYHAVGCEPDDPLWYSSNSWGQGYRDQWDMAIINCPNAWCVQTGDPSIVVAVSDTGIDYAHADIAANMWRNPGEIPGNGVDDDGNGYVDDYHGYDFAYGDSDPVDGRGHGTHVAGTIGAVGNNGMGIAGMNWACSLMAVKGLDDTGSGSSSGLAAGIAYAADNGARVINMSWGGTPSSTIHDALVYAHNRNVVLCAAASNDDANITTRGPACDNYVITVAASDQNDQKCYFSNWGIKTAVAAPGGDGTGSLPCQAVCNVLSLKSRSWVDGSCPLTVGTNYLRLAGTSMASPHVAGLAALVLAENPSWTNEQVRQAIQMRADNILTPGFDRYSGFGRINAYSSVTSPPPTVALITSPVNGATVEGTVQISGTTGGPGFADWVLDYGIGFEPTTWTTTAVGTTPVTNGVLANWNTSGAPASGLYTLRLRATGGVGAQNAEYRLEVNVAVSGGGTCLDDFETGNFSRFPWQNCGGPSWVISTAQKHGGTYSAKAGTISHNGTTCLQVCRTGPAGNVSFWHKTSSETNYDYLRFYIDGVQKGAWSGCPSSWSQASYPVSAGQHCYRWVYTKDGSVNSCSNTVWIDDISFPCHVDPPTVTGITPSSGSNAGGVSVEIAGTGFLPGAAVKLARSGQADINATSVVVVSATRITCALNLAGAQAGQWNVVVTNSDGQYGTLANGFTVTSAPQGHCTEENFESGNFSRIPWQNCGGPSWVISTAQKHGGAYSARAGTISHSGTTCLQVTLTGSAGNVSFWHKTSSETNYDYLRFYIDDFTNYKGRWSGCPSSWSQATYPVTAGTHTYRWVYTKDGSVNSCSDTVWIDDISFPCQSPEIDVTDSIPPLDDLAMGFGDVELGDCRTETVTIQNTGQGPLRVQDVRIVTPSQCYREDFNDGEAQAWQEDVYADWSVVSQQYRAYKPVVSATESMVATYGGETWEDLSYEVKLRHETVPPGGNPFAQYMLFRATPDVETTPAARGSAYGFGIDAGMYLIFKCVNGAQTIIKTWTPSPYVRPDGDWNTLAVSAVGSSLRFSINGNLAYQATDTSLTSGRVGLLGFTPSGYATVHYFDDAVVCPPGASSAEISVEQQRYNEQSIDGQIENCPGATVAGALPSSPPVEVADVGGDSPVSGFCLEGEPGPGTEIQPGQSVTFNVKFCPTVLGPAEATLRITSDDPDEPVVNVALEGAGLEPNDPPVCDANGPYSAECQGTSNSVQLDGRGSSDPDGDPLTYSWSADCPNASFDHASSATPILTLDTAPGCGLTCTATLVVNDGRLSSSCSTTVTVRDTNPPTVTAGSIAPCHATQAEAEAAAIAATSATDNCTPEANLRKMASTVGDCAAVITVTVTDECGNSASVQYSTRIDGAPPTVTAGSIAPCHATQAEAEAAAIAATSATDNCTPEANLRKTASTVGDCAAVITVIVTDECGNSSPVSYSTRIDGAAPSVSCSVAVPSLWPANHDLVNVGLGLTAVDNCVGDLVNTVLVFCNEGDEEPTGDGNFSPDAKNIASGSLRLRAERKGNGSGRVYLIVVTSVDRSGNVGRAYCTVVVPHGQNNTSIAAVNAKAMAAKAYFDANGAPPAGYVAVGFGPIIGPKQ